MVKSEWVAVHNGKHLTIQGAKRLPRRTKKFISTIFDLLAPNEKPKFVVTSVGYYEELIAVDDLTTKLSSALMTTKSSS